MFRWLKYFCWRKTGWYNRKRVWLDAPKLYAVVSIEKWSGRGYWWRPLWFTHCRHSYQPVLFIHSGWLKRTVMLEFIRGGVSSKDIDDLRNKISDLTYFKDVRRKRIPWWKSKAVKERSQ